MTLRQGSTLTWSAPRWPVAATLDLSGLNDTDRRRVADVAARDVAATRPAPTDTYFGGKALHREAQLIGIADALGVDATQRRAQVTSEFEAWAQPDAATRRGTRCFVYDDAARGIVGLEPSFGSELFNDHHFHYGYFLHAAGTLALGDAGLAVRLAPVFDLLAADIAMPSGTDVFPGLRGFDVYAGHSWASGTAPFADGNNQESSSEAVNAWAGLTLWARARGDAALEAQAQWMHALEAQAALAYWLQPDLTDFAGYRHRIVGIGWGAKRDYATWFSPDPAALLMIQVIPAGPGLTYLAHAPEQIAATVAEAVGEGGFARTYGDYCLMYAALADRAKAIAALPQVVGHLDDGLTETYLTAFVLSR
ncbi:glycosyl hydrolase [Propioniciclava flava]|uniref:glycosyl hydrolase n=1 Tax=Propioniciclava flava TaxID=2072026 RepID=UPI0013E91393|nr:glycosyl hydrolase [Propioniciclava flava]